MKLNDRRLPPALRSRSAAESIREDVAPYLGTTAEQRTKDVVSLAALAFEQLRDHPDRERLLAWQDPRSPEAERLWLSLVARGGRK